MGQIEVQLKRKHDLIPNLVETVKVHASHERETLDAVTSGRSLAQSVLGEGAGVQSKAEGALGGALSRLLAVAESYPELKANQNFLALSELSSTENKIADSRSDYNDMVLHGNNTRQTVPSNIVAGLTGFKPGGFLKWKLPQRRTHHPSVSFNL